MRLEQSGYVLAEALLALFLVAALFMQSEAVIYPLMAGVSQARVHTEAGFAGVSALEWVRLDPSLDYGRHDVSDRLPFDHGLLLSLEREPFPALPGLDQYTVTVSRDGREIVRLTTLVADAGGGRWRY